jgi:hypothetical protein
LQVYSDLISELHSALRLNSSKARAVLAYVITFNFNQVFILLFSMMIFFINREINSLFKLACK